jgi:hypothetical protein
MRRQWTYEQIPLGDIYYSQDTIRDIFADGRSLSNLIAWFKHSDDPDQVLCDNRISVVPYPSGTSALYTLDNRRLFCLKFVYPPTLLLWIKRYDCVQAHDQEWDLKFSTVTRSQSVAVKRAGYKSSLSCYSRHIPIPGRLTCTYAYSYAINIATTRTTKTTLTATIPSLPLCLGSFAVRVS